MSYEILSPTWRIIYGVAGALGFGVGALALPVEVWWALHGAPLAWLAVPLLAPVVVVGWFLLRAAVRGRVKQRNLVIGRRPAP